MNADAALWLAGWVLGMALIAGTGFVIWAYQQSVQTQAEHDEILRQRQIQGRMQVREIKLYSLETPVNSGRRLVSK